MDCLEGMKYMKDNSVDLVLTDPPYNISRKRTFTRDNAKDVTLDFGDWDYQDEEDFYKWFKIVCKEWKRVLKREGQILTFGPRDWKYAKVLDDVFKIKRELAWKKSNPAPHYMKNSYITSYERIFWCINKGVEKKEITFNFLEQKEMHDFIETSVCMGKERTSHKTQKSIEVLQKLLRIHSDEGDLVLDSFMGSGSTAEACMSLKRDFIGFENDKESLDIMINERFGLRAKDIIERVEGGQIK